MSRSKMESVLYDIQLAQAMFDSKHGDFNSIENQKALIDAVLKKHAVSQQSLDSSLVWYSKRSDVFLKVNDSIIARMKREQGVWSDVLRLESELVAGYSNRDAKLFVPFSFLTTQEPIFSFDIDSINSENISIDSINIISFNVLGLSPVFDVESSVRFEYNDTSIIQQFKVEDSFFKLEKPVLENQRSLKNISGFFRIESPRPFNVLLYNIRYTKELSPERENQSANK